MHESNDQYYSTPIKQGARNFCKGRKLDIALLRECTSLQNRSGMARDVEEFHSFTCTSTTGITIPAFAFPVETGPHLLILKR